MGFPGNDELPGRIVIAHPDTSPEEIKAALERLPRDAWSSEGQIEELFPSSPRTGACRVCGTVTNLTKEHIPPRSAFNKASGKSPAMQDWFRTEDLEFADDGATFQGGVSGYVLCRSCNNATGRFAREYQTWAYGAANLLVTQEKTLAELDHLEANAYVNLKLVDVYPGRFVRQAISMLLTVSGSPDLGDRHPVLRQLALNGPSALLPHGMKLFMTLYAGPLIRFAGGPAGQRFYTYGSDSWGSAIEVAFPPFAFQLILDGDTGKASGLDISEFAGIDVNSARDFRIEGLMIGFGHTPFPLDYRPLGSVEQVDSED